jgi:hypothetical protein
MRMIESGFDGDYSTEEIKLIYAASFYSFYVSTVHHRVNQNSALVNASSTIDSDSDRSKLNVCRIVQQILGRFSFASMAKCILILAAAVFLNLGTSAQQVIPPLERKVTLEVNAVPATSVLQLIESQAGVSFSYASSLLSANQLVSVKLKNKTVREALDKIFEGKVMYKSRNNHIILTKSPEQQKVIGGYVENAKGEKLKGASVYDPSTMASATTDEYGYFEMKIRRTTPQQLQISKTSYADTTMPLQPTSPTLQYIVMDERKDTSLQHVFAVMKSSKDSILTAVKHTGEWIKERLIWNENLRNIRDSLYRPFQISLVPFVGTNGRLSGNVVNDYSWNILAGYNGGVNKAEFAGLMNIDKADVSYFQFAGLTNIVGGTLTGVQFAGFNNVNLGEVNGVQFAGFSNFGLNKLDGLQFAGFSNICGSSLRGLQFSGFSNITAGELKGAQIAGFGNIAASGFRGIQLGGFFNTSGKHARGIQISGFINVAHHLKGSQLGVFNFADSLSGVPIGLFSFVKSGYHKLEFAYDDMEYAHVSFRSGVRHFYNIISAGTRTDWNTDTVDWTFSYGLGMAPRISERVDLNIDLTANQMIHGNIASELNMIAKLQTGVDIHLTKRISIFGAVVMNGYFYEDHTRLAAGYEPSRSIYDTNLGGGFLFDSWLGWKAGIRFF